MAIDTNAISKIVSKNNDALKTNTNAMSDIANDLDNIVSSSKRGRKGNARSKYGGAAMRRNGNNNFDNESRFTKYGRIADEVGNFFTPEGFGYYLKKLLPATSEFFGRWEKVQQSMYSTAREMGVSTRQIEGFTKSIAKNTIELGNKLGMTYAEIGKLISSYTSGTGRNLFMSDEEFRRMSEMYRLGGDAAVGISSELDRFGMSIVNSADHFAKIQLNSEAYGLNASKYTKDFQQNIKLAASYSFKNGIDGVSKMTMLSERLKFNMQSVAQVADRASTIEGAIDMSARMQMLGGTYAQNFGNPVQLLYESLNDMEALTKRIVNTVQGKASFNAETGQFNVDNITRRFLKEMANMTGISFDDLFNMSVSNNRIRLIDTQLNAEVRSRESDKQFIENQARYDTDTKKWVMTWLDKQGNTITKSVAEIKPSDMAQIKEGIVGEEDLNKDVHAMRQLLQKYMSERGVTLTTASERIEGAKSAYDSKTFNVFDRWFKSLSDRFGGANLGNILGLGVGAAFGAKAVGGLLGKIGRLDDLIKTTRSGEYGGAAQARVNPSTLSETSGVYSRAERVAAANELKSRGYKFRNGNEVYTPDGRIIRENIPGKKINAAEVLEREGLRPKSTNAMSEIDDITKVKNAGKGTKGWWKGLSKGSKIAGGAAVALDVAMGAYEIYGNVKDYNQRNDYIMNDTSLNSYARQSQLRQNLHGRQIANSKAVGGTIGGVAGAAALAWIPVIGPIVGGAVGNAVGRFVGGTVGKAIRNADNKKTSYQMIVESITPNVEAISTNVGLITAMMGAGSVAGPTYFYEETAKEMATVQANAFNGNNTIGLYGGEYGGYEPQQIGGNGNMSVQAVSITSPSVYINTPNVGTLSNGTINGEYDVHHDFKGTIELKSQDKSVELTYSQMNEIASMVAKEMSQMNNSGALAKNTPYQAHTVNQGLLYTDGRTGSRT